MNLNYTLSGSDGQIQYNNNGAFAGSNALTFNKDQTDPVVTLAGTNSSLLKLGQTLSLGNSAFTYANDHLNSDSGLVILANNNLDLRCLNGPMTIGCENVSEINIVNGARIMTIDRDQNIFANYGNGQQLGVSNGDISACLQVQTQTGPGLFLNNGDNPMGFVQTDDYQVSFNPNTTNYVRLSGVANPTDPQDAANKSYVDSAIAGLLASMQQLVRTGGN